MDIDAGKACQLAAHDIFQHRTLPCCVRQQAMCVRQGMQAREKRLLRRIIRVAGMCRLRSTE